MIYRFFKGKRPGICFRGKAGNGWQWLAMDCILAGQRGDSSFATTAIFSRFPNKNPENATLAENHLLLFFKDRAESGGSFCDHTHFHLRMHKFQATAKAA
jgi:hypothetical protein